MKNVSKIRWKWRELLLALGGSSGVGEHFAARGIAPPPVNTIKGWITRNSVPGAWAPLLIMIGQEEYVPGTRRKVLPKVSSLWARGRK